MGSRVRMWWMKWAEVDVTAYGDACPAMRHPEGDKAVALGKELN